LFNQGQKPAVDIGGSVSRVGGAAQESAMRKLVGNLKLELSQFEEVEHFTRFGTEVDKATQQQIQKGKRILKVFQQGANAPYTFSFTIVILFALTKGYLNPIPDQLIGRYEQALRQYFLQHENKLLNEIAKETILTEQITSDLELALNKFTDQWITD